MSRTMSCYDLRDALAQPGCAVCRLVARDAERNLDGMLWESFNDASVRNQLRWALAQDEESFRRLAGVGTEGAPAPRRANQEGIAWIAC